MRTLEGIRIIDTSTGPVGGLATMVLADFGADVVKIEPPGGDRFRSLPGSPMWLRGKRSVVLDLHQPSGIGHLHRLVSGADVVVVSGPPDRAGRWGIDADGAEKCNPSIIHCSITGWGERGPLAGIPGYTSAVAAAAGRMQFFAGQVRRPGPVYAAVPVAVHAAAHGAVQGILSALIAGPGDPTARRVSTSLLQALLPYDLVDLLMVQLAESSGVPLPDSASIVSPDMPTLNYHPVLARDGGWIQCGNLLEHLFLSFLDAIDLYGELLEDDRFIDSPANWTPDAIEHARDRILLRMRDKTSTEWMDLFFANGNVAAEPFRSPAEALRHPDLLANGAVVTLDDPHLGAVTMVGAVATLGATPAVIDRPGPAVGQHTAEVLDEAPRIPADVPGAPVGPLGAPVTPLGAPVRPLGAPTGPRGRRPVAGRPLDGVTIVEFASVIAAPLGASMLGDLGARVIRVEPIDGDSFRHLRPNGIMAVKTTASKESICLDLKRPEGRAIARSLVARADMLIHNYRPGVPERLGIGYAELHAAYPRLVWVSVNGYGPNGPGAHRPATHPVAGAAMGGAGYQAGRALDTPCSTLEEIRETARQLMRANEPSPDPNTSVVVASAALVALLARRRSGEGQPVYVDMLCANAHANADAFLSYEGMRARPDIDGEHHGTGPCHRLYPTADGWVFLAITTDTEWRRFCAAAGCPGLSDDARFDSDAARSDHGREISDLLLGVFSTRSAASWQQLLADAGVACVQADAAPPGSFYARHEQMRVNGFVPLAPHARFGDIRRWGPLVTVGGPADRYGPGVLAGEHTDELLTELGFGPGDIAELRAAGIAGSEQP